MAISDILKALEEGRITDAHAAAVDAAAKEAAAAPPPAPDPLTPAPVRAVEPIIFDLFDAIVSHLGTPPALTGFLDELESAIEKL